MTLTIRNVEALSALEGALKIKKFVTVNDVAKAKYVYAIKLPYFRTSLNQLAKKGLVSKSGGRPIFYNITKAGKAALRKWERKFLKK